MTDYTKEERELAKKLKTVELFSGSKSFSKVAKELGHTTYTVDNNPDCEPDLVFNLLENDWPKDLDYALKYADVIWMSPPCNKLSLVTGNKYWTADRQPRTDEADEARQLLLICQRLADWADKEGKIYFIENPRARARWFLPETTRQTVWYCQYGDNRAKPTDIWTNLQGWKAKTCKNNNLNCHHERAKRGSKTGTQGLSNAKTRGQIPKDLFTELFNQMKKDIEVRG